MDTHQAEIETLKASLVHWEVAYREVVRECDARDRLIAELKSDLQAARGSIQRMKSDRNAEE